MLFYKALYNQLSTTDVIPGYCTAAIDEAYDGLYEAINTEFLYPLYKFIVTATIPPYPFTDIVGIDRSTKNHTNEEVIKFLQSIGVNIGDTGHKLRRHNQVREKALEEQFQAMMRSFKPGWLWNDAVEIGRPGESIINIPCKLELVDGDELAQVATQVMREAGMAPDKLLSNIAKHPVRYSIDLTPHIIGQAL